MRPKQKPKILIVEDNKHNHELYRDAFEKAGFEVTLRENADGFLIEEVANVVKPDIISMDLMMGKDGEAAQYDGFEALELLKHDLRTHEVPVIILTSFFEESKVRRAKELGAVDFITLPGQSMAKLPEHYLRYLEDPKHYKPVHTIFREEK
jgi:CheY-like chemotaxis protein